ncbi:MAG: lactate/malate dehydrogenase family protein [Candidatus Margulisiibacteriota bacterium]|jgi:L-lactate dehydrogenase
MKVSIVGTGRLGSNLAYTLALKQLATEISLINPLSPELAKGHCIDIQHALTMIGQVKMSYGGYETTADADIIVITSGVTRKQEESRLDLSEKNVEITRQAICNILDYNQSAILILANNPVDITTFVALKVSGFPRARVIGTGTLLDSLRFRFLLSEAANLDPRSINALLLGEHGDSAVPILSTATVNGLPISDVSALSAEDIQRTVDKVKQSGKDLLGLKGGSTYSPALSIATIIDAIVNDQHQIMPLTTYVQGEYGLDGICISLPVRIGRAGVEEILEIKLTEDERTKLNLSAGILESEVTNLNN